MTPALLSALASLAPLVQSELPALASVAVEVSHSLWGDFLAAVGDHPQAAAAVSNLAQQVDKGTHMYVQFGAGDWQALQKLAATAAPVVAEAVVAATPAAALAPLAGEAAAALVSAASAPPAPAPTPTAAPDAPVIGAGQPAAAPSPAPEAPLV